MALTADDLDAIRAIVQETILTSPIGLPIQTFPTSSVSVAAGGITSASFAPGAIDAAAIAAAAIDAATFAPGAIDATAIAADAIGAAQLSAAAVAKIVTGVWAAAARTVTGGVLSAGSPGTFRRAARGVLAITAGNTAQTAAIGFTVDQSKSVLTLLGWSWASGSGGADFRIAPYLTFLNNDNVQATCASAMSGTQMNVAWQVAEYY